MKVRVTDTRDGHQTGETMNPDRETAIRTAVPQYTFKHLSITEVGYSMCQFIDEDSKVTDLSRTHVVLSWHAERNGQSIGFGELTFSMHPDGGRIAQCDIEGMSDEFVRALFAELAERVIARAAAQENEKENHSAETTKEEQ